MTTELHPLANDLALHKIVGYALKNRASDIHLKVGRPPAVRIDSVLRFVPTDDLTDVLNQHLTLCDILQGEHPFAMHAGAADLDAAAG